jgi:hypothetical protein
MLPRTSALLRQSDHAHRSGYVSFLCRKRHRQARHKVQEKAKDEEEQQQCRRRCGKREKVVDEE